MQLKPGMRLASVVDTTQVVVVRAPADEIDLRCGGPAMAPVDANVVTASGAIADDHHDGTLLGKRYANESVGLELLCTKGGEASLALGEEPLTLQGAKPLPSSD